MDEFLQYLEGMDDPLLTATNKIKKLLQENEALKRERDQAAFNADAELKDNLYQTQAHCEHLEATIAEQEEKFKSHTKAVQEFLNEAYAIMVDPLADGTLKVAETTAAILKNARADRNTIAEQAKLIERMQADLKLPYKLSPNGGISFSEYLRQAKLAARALEAKEGTK